MNLLIFSLPDLYDVVVDDDVDDDDFDVMMIIFVDVPEVIVLQY